MHKLWSFFQICGNLRFSKVAYNSITVDWDRACYTTHYRVFLRKPLEGEKWRSFKTKNDTCSFTIKNLPINTNFVFSVCACNGTVQGPLCKESEVISTQNLAFKMKGISILREETLPNYIPVYDVPFRVERNGQLKVRKVTIGNWYNFFII